MNKKGFTLMEILGAIIILGILVIFAVVTFTRNMGSFRDDYYTDTVRTLTESGKEFFNDNRKYRPSEVLNGQIVPLNTLIAEHYIDDIKDYNGNSCSNSSYVIVIKNGKDDYSYHTCLVCPGDDYSNMDDIYCDSAWTNSTTIEYNIAKPPELYKYKGTPKSTLKEELGIKVSYVKKNSKGEVIGVVDGTGFDDTPMIYPDNVDNVDTNKLGKYKLTYRYQDQIVDGSVIIYEFKNPTLAIKKINVKATNLTDGTETVTEDFHSGDWAQKIIVSLTAGQPDAGNVNISTANLNNIVHQFQWNKDGIWQDFCGGDNCTGREVTTEMNESIRFRSIDVNGIASEETNPTIIRIDNTKPTCSLQTEGPHKDNEWFTGNVAVSFSKNEDLVGTSPEAVSEIQTSNITKEGGVFTRFNILNLTHIDDTRGVKYVGFVEDQAFNYIKCDIWFQKDATDPECSLATAGTMGTNNWYSSDSVSTSFTQYYDATSGVKEYGIGSYTGDRTVVDPQDTGGITYTGYIKDVAGNTATCSISYKKDSTPPVCELKTTGTMGNNGWYKSATVDVSFNSYTDNLSGVNTYGIAALTGSKVVTQTANTASVTFTGHIRDNAGNTNTCSINFKKDDGSEAKNGGCYDIGNNNWVKADFVNMEHGLKVKPISECETASGTAYRYTSDCVLHYKAAPESGKALATRQGSGATFTTKSGVAINCPSFTEEIYIDNEPPLCTSSGGNPNWVNTSLTVIGTCDDQAGSGCATATVSLPEFTSNTERYNVSPGTVTDNVGNTTECPGNQTVKIDKTAPTCTSASSPAGWTNGSVTVTGTCADTGGSGCVGNISQTYSGQQNSSKSPGTVYDNAGNSKNCPNSAVKIDTTPPTCTSSSSPAGWTNGSVTVTGTCHDTGGSGCAGNASQTFSGQQNTTKSPGKVYDNAGNASVNNCPNSNVQIDTTNPTCGRVTYGGDSTGGVSVSIACSDTGGSGCSGKSTTASSSGAITLKDGAGNTASCSYKVTSYKQKRTRTWNTCLTGSPNECTQYSYSYGWWDSCHTTTEEGSVACNHGCSPGGTCNASVYNNAPWACSQVSCTDNGNGTYTRKECGCGRSSYCSKYENTCQGGWNGWSSYSNGSCSSSNTSTWQCEERTMYHGG